MPRSIERHDRPQVRPASLQERWCHAEDPSLKGKVRDEARQSKPHLITPEIETDRLLLHLIFTQLFYREKHRGKPAVF